MIIFLTLNQVPCSICGMRCLLASCVSCGAGWQREWPAVLAGTVSGLQCWLAPCVSCGADWHRVWHVVLAGIMCVMRCWLALCVACGAGWHHVCHAVLTGTVCGLQCWLVPCVACGAGWHHVCHAVLAGTVCGMRCWLACMADSCSGVWVHLPGTVSQMCQWSGVLGWTALSCTSLDCDMWQAVSHWLRAGDWWSKK